MKRELDVARQRRGRDTEDDLVFEVLEQLAEAVVVRFVNHDHPKVVKPNALVIQSVVECLHHGDVTPVVFPVLQVLDLTVDDFVGDTNLRQHVGGLTQQLDAVGQNQDTLARFQDVTLRQFRENDRFSATGWQLVQQVVIVRKLPHPSHDRLDGLGLVAVKVFPLLALEAINQRLVHGDCFGHGLG